MSFLWPKCSDADDQLTWTSHDCKRERNQNTCPKLVARVHSYSRANSTPLQAWVFIALPFWTSSTDFCHCLVQAFLSSARTQLTNKKKKLGGSLALGVEGRGTGGWKSFAQTFRRLHHMSTLIKVHHLWIFLLSMASKAVFQGFFWLRLTFQLLSKLI